MARRISLPSSDELFGDRAPYAARAARTQNPPRGNASASPARRPTAPPRRRGVTVRIERVETRLRDLPIDTLLELRDGLEALLIGGTLTDADVERVLAVADS